MESTIGHPPENSGKRVAVLSRAAGLSAAYYLRRAGHEVTVFERMPQAGGLLAYGIPAYRLPREVLAKQLAAHERLGVQFTLGTQVDKSKFDEIAAAFDAVFVACGAWQETEAALGESACPPGNSERLTWRRSRQTVSVIGGSNTAIGVAARCCGWARSPSSLPPHQDRCRPQGRGGQGRGGVRFPSSQPVGERRGRRNIADLPHGAWRTRLERTAEAGRVEGSEVRGGATWWSRPSSKPDYSFLPAGFVDGAAAEGRRRDKGPG
jgi:glycine/D-amino acid oxidase-like deaminating enzyme